MFNKLIFNGKKTKLYYHKTDGGAEYLTDKFITCPDGSKKGVFKNAKKIIRIDGGEIEILKLEGRE
jgi:hypothetical protein